jgi:hypothetical protein
MTTSADVSSDALASFGTRPVTQALRVTVEFARKSPAYGAKPFLLSEMLSLNSVVNSQPSFKG